MKMKKLGIVGGMGPYATALFFEKLTELTDASKDQEHIECIIHSAVQIPDRTAFLKQSEAKAGGMGAESPRDKLIEVSSSLSKQVDLLAMPCMTSHHFYDEIASNVSVPVLDMQRICAEYLEHENAKDETSVLSVGIMATEGTVLSGRLQRILHEHGILPVLPIDQGIITKLICDVKAGKPLSNELFMYAASELAGRGAGVVLLGCTELQVYNDTSQMPDLPPLIDSAELLAKRCIQAVGGKVKIV